VARARQLIERLSAFGTEGGLALAGCMLLFSGTLRTNSDQNQSILFSVLWVGIQEYTQLFKMSPKVTTLKNTKDSAQTLSPN
jgi:hypothetical protein